MAEYTEQALRAVVDKYEATRAAALADRDASLRDFAEAGWRAADLQRVTGYSRETVRQALNPEARQAINAGRREATARRRQPYYIVKSLDELHGPAEGTVTLPPHLAAPGDADYDLAYAREVAGMYEMVLVRAASLQDVRAWVDPRLLVRVWPLVILPERLTDGWENRIPELARARRSGWPERRIGRTWPTSGQA